jgi:NADPH:quinone reductase
LRSIGATHVIDSSDPDFEAKLTDAVAETGATMGFDATGGGKLVSKILNAMESAIQRQTNEYSRYGSNVPKQVYLYGMLDVSPTIIDRRFGFAWGMGGWLLWPAMQRLGEATVERMKQRVVRELKTTFASHYTRTIGLADLLDLDMIEAADRKSTGEKFLIDPSR